MSVLIVLAILIARGSKTDAFLERHYRRNRKVLIWICISVGVAFVLIVNMWFADHVMYENKRLELAIITILYILINGVLLYNVYVKNRTQKELYERKEYEEYMKSLTDELNSREHEYKNHINHMIAIAEAADIEDKGSRIVQYGEELLLEEKAKEKKHVISDNTTISVFIFQMNKKAQEKDINFEYFLERSFPEYSIKEHDLVELLYNAVNNAFEAVASLPQDKRNIFVSFCGGEIEVVNAISGSLGGIERLKQKNVSTKGAGRGYGMSNIMAVAEKNHIKIDTYIENDNFILSAKF